MYRLLTLLPLCLTLGLVTTAVAKHPQTDAKSRVHEQELSHEEHMVDGKHNPKFDQDALFGKSAEEFRDLPDSTKQARLKNLFAVMDTDHDGFVSGEELSEWLKGNALEEWSEYSLKPSESLTWEVYEKKVTGPDGEYDEKDEESKKEHLKQDKRRWDVADANHDGVLDFAEAAAFFHPENHLHMQDVVVIETLEEIDRDRDGYISQKEYIEDLWRPSSPSEVEPEWINEERKNFDQERDKNHDGKLDKEEIKSWLFPPGEDHITAEVEHLLSNCDTNRDAKLSEDELLTCHETLIGSSLTNYGELLAEHDEL